MSDALEIAMRMTPQERDEIYALALGFGNMLMAQHRAEHDAFAAMGWKGRWGGCPSRPRIPPMADSAWSLSRPTRAAIDLQTGAPKATALATINGGIQRASAALKGATHAPD